MNRSHDGRWQNRGLWLALALTAAIGLWPVLTGKPATRETVFTIMLSIALASSLNILLGWIPADSEQEHVQLLKSVLEAISAELAARGQSDSAEMRRR